MLPLPEIPAACRRVLRDWKAQDFPGCLAGPGTALGTSRSTPLLQEAGPAGESSPTLKCNWRTLWLVQCWQKKDEIPLGLKPLLQIICHIQGQAHNEHYPDTREDTMNENQHTTRKQKHQKSSRHWCYLLHTWCKRKKIWLRISTRNSNVGI